MSVAAAALVVSCLAILISLGTLGWNIYSWHHTGARLKVRATSLFTSHPIGGKAKYLAIEAINTGRTATTVTGFGFKIPSGEFLLLMESAIPTANVPSRLDPGDSMTFAVDPLELRDAAIERNVNPSDCTPYAVCGHGRFEGKFDNPSLEVLRELT